ncbi:endonuclease-like protein [Chryseobacterium phage MA9V-2]|nr:endonuclease-like protein [Chryseobacterium phage MA9V-2]
MIKRKRQTYNDVIADCKKAHGNYYDYVDTSATWYKKTDKLRIICPVHGEFEQSGKNHSKGQGCTKCKKNIQSYDQIITKVLEIHASRGYIYEDTSAEFTVSTSSFLKANCPKHGEFEVRAHAHSVGVLGCQGCYTDDLVDRQRYSKDEMHSICKVILAKRKCTILDITFYVDKANSNFIINCPKHGNFEKNAYQILLKQGCPNCVGYNSSKAETFLRDHLVGQGIADAVGRKRFRHHETNKLYEIDVQSPSLKIGIEFNGIHWHRGEVFKHKHMLKTTSLDYMNWQLIHIFEDEYHAKFNAVMSMINHKHGVTKQKIHARKTKTALIDEDTYVQFCNENCIQIFDKLAFNYVGLYLAETLVGVIAYNVDTKANVDIINIAMLNNHNIIGGVGKLVAYVERSERPASITATLNRQFSTKHNVFAKLGFDFVEYTEQNFMYSIHSSPRILPEHTSIEHQIDSNKVWDVGNIIMKKVFK